MKNIVLIGMPACGKSTIGVLLAKSLNLNFIDTDLIIQQKYNKLLSEIIQIDGITGFIEKESNAIRSINCIDSFCISTGGSAVFSDIAMQHLQKNGIIIYIKVDFKEIQERISDIKTRGVVLEESKTLYDSYLERTPLYEKYANITINANNKTVEEIVYEISSVIQSIQ